MDMVPRGSHNHHSASIHLMNTVPLEPLTACNVHMCIEIHSLIQNYYHVRNTLIFKSYVAPLYFCPIPRSL